MKLANLSIANRMAVTLLAATGLTTFAIATIVLSTESIIGPSSEAGHRLLLESVVLWLLVLMGIALLWYLMSLYIARPLTNLVLFAQQVRKGETHKRFPIEGNNEIALVASSINAMLDQIVGQHAHLRTQVETLTCNITGVGQGDLRLRAVVTDGAVGLVAEAFNAMLEQLSALVIGVKLVTRDVLQTAEGTAQQTSAYVQSAEQQLAQIRTASHTVHQMAQASQLVAVSAGQLGEETHNTRSFTLTGRERIAEIIRGMRRLHEDVQATAQHVQQLANRSLEMQQLVDLIATLAHQTNRLALDSAIQAATAGEHGRGFEAVSKDMRRLAERTKEEVTKIQAQVQGVQEEIQAAASSMSETEREAIRGNSYVSATETVFVNIFDLAERQSEGIGVIIEQARQQWESSRTLASLMEEVSTTTHGSTDTIRAIAFHISQAARKADHLDQSVGRFRLREGEAAIRSPLIPS